MWLPTALHELKMICPNKTLVQFCIARIMSAAVKGTKARRTESHDVWILESVGIGTEGICALGWNGLVNDVELGVDRDVLE